MRSFADIVGQKPIKEHLQKTLQTGKISHACIFYGEKGCGKKALASVYARALQCENGGTEPCNACISCKQALNSNQPDIIYVQHEKPNLISVDEIREQVNYNIVLKPYSSARKVYIIDEAEKMNPQAQNALLKTLEEPPEYATILLLTSNLEGLLQTIRSRCVTLTFQPVLDVEIERYLMKEIQVPDYKASICAAFARGNIGRAKELAASVEFEALKDDTIKFMQTISEKSVSDLAIFAKEKADKDADTEGFLELMQMWYRDLLLYKATGKTQSLIFKDDISSIKRMALKCTYEGLNRVLDGVEEARIRLFSNVNAELTLEWLLLLAKEATT